jgi:hypothetical protein
LTGKNRSAARSVSRSISQEFLLLLGVSGSLHTSRVLVCMPARSGPRGMRSGADPEASGCATIPASFPGVMLRCRAEENNGRCSGRKR